ncbi:odorant binding protein 1 [Nomia melanderi]|uniref:odorant binding protein 1 n=1 Tax=Nomia melanderi TaxID=2448451 RepID=UPI00130400E1|nr:general odorant-binding protein 83a-like [Nomia melanderi]
MGTNHGLLFLGIVFVHAACVFAGVPDWIPPEVIDMVQDDKNRCMAEHGTQEAEIAEVQAGRITSARSITCYMYCLLEAFSLVDDEGNLESDMLMGLLPENLQDTAESVLAKCTPAAGADPCEKIYNLAVCVYNTVPDLWFVV